MIFVSGNLTQGETVEQGARRLRALTGAMAVTAALAGCEGFRVMNDYETAESPDVAAAPWPRLVDVPQAPPPGSYSAAVPDPTRGEALRAALLAKARAAAIRREDLAGPVLAEDEAARLSRP